MVTTTALMRGDANDLVHDKHHRRSGACTVATLGPLRWTVSYPDLWAFLESLHRGEFLSGAVTAIERFGVFVALDDGPDHPVFPASGSSPSLNCPGDASRQH